MAARLQLGSAATICIMTFDSCLVISAVAGAVIAGALLFVIFTQ
jgi:hypothetical protein